MEKKKKDYLAQLSGYVLNSVPTRNMHSSQVLQRQLQKMTNLSHKEKSQKKPSFKVKKFTEISFDPNNRDLKQNDYPKITI